MWLDRFSAEVLRSGDDGGEPDTDEARVVEAMAGLASDGSLDDRADAVIAALPGGDRVSDAALARAALAVRDAARPGEPGDERAQARLWQQLAARFSDPRSASRVAMCAADAALRRGDESAAVAEMARALDRDAALWPQVCRELSPEALARARRASGPVARSFALAELAHRLPELPESIDPAGSAGAVVGDDDGAVSSPASRAPDEFDDADADEIRERYSELLDRYRDDPDASARIRALGRQIAELEAAGVLPRVMVLRGAWRDES